MLTGWIRAIQEFPIDNLLNHHETLQVGTSYQDIDWDQFWGQTDQGHSEGESQK